MRSPSAMITREFLYSVSSEQIQGVGRDADYIAGKIAARRGVRRRSNRQTIHRRSEKHNRSRPVLLYRTSNLLLRSNRIP
jgi:hypothetical protein